MSRNYDTRYQGRQFTVGEVIADESRSKDWHLTEAQGEIAKAALEDQTKTIGQVVDETGRSLSYVALVLEWATMGDLVDMVLAYEGYDVEQKVTDARATGDWSEVDEMYEETFPEIMAGC